METESSASKLLERTDEKLDALLKRLRPLVDNVVEARQYYEKRARRPKNAFRVSGVAVILLSLSIPFIASLRFTGKDVLLSAFAVLIAIVTSLGSFYKWEHTWRSYRQAEAALGHLLALWDFRMIEATQEPDVVKGREKIITATQQLLEAAHKVTSTETEEFFSKVEWPGEKKK
jgi:hypothetical protein